MLWPKLFLAPLPSGCLFTALMTSVELPPSHLSGLTMHEKSDYDCILANLCFSEENADDDLLSVPPEPLPYAVAF